MARFKRILRKLLFPGGGWVALAVLLGGASLALTFLVFGDRSPFAYVSYILSAYALTVLVAAIVPLIPAVRQKIHRVPLAHRYLTDKHFSVWCGLALSLLINLGFAVLKLFYAIRYSSFWDGGLAIYYILLCAVRVYLLCSIPGAKKSLNVQMELRCYRITGVFLFLLDAALAVISTLIVIKGNGYYYSGTLVYAIALHAFYSLTLAIVNTVKYRKLNSPVLSAAKAVNLTTALVSIFSLETALLTQFGEGDEWFRLVMTSITAFCVCVAVLGIAVFIPHHHNFEKLFELCNFFSLKLPVPLLNQPFSKWAQTNIGIFTYLQENFLLVHYQQN